MLRPIREKQIELEMVSIDQLVPDDHLVRKIDITIDFTFIYDKVKPYYSEDNGRPPIDPVMLFKMMFLGYLYGIRSERQLEKEIQTNVAYRWFLGLGLTDDVLKRQLIPTFQMLGDPKKLDFFRSRNSTPIFCFSSSLPSVPNSHLLQVFWLSNLTGDITASGGFELLKNALMDNPGHPLISFAVAINVLVGIT